MSDTPQQAIAQQDSPATRRRAALALALLVPAPTIGVFFALHLDATAGEALGKGIFMFSKAWLFVMPVLWLVFIEKRRPTIPRPTRAGMGWAIGTGIAIFITIAVAYFGYAREQIDLADMASKMIEAGLNAKWKLALMAIYWCTINSLLEEYVWRWFVFEKCKTLTPRLPLLAVVLSGLMFTLHHFIALMVYLPQLHLNVLASLGVFIGGATWSWLYLKSKNIYAGYVSHVFADIIIFGIAYQIAFG